jgi:hypothetical protein
VAHAAQRRPDRTEVQLADDKCSHDAIHDHQVENFARENGLTPDLVWDLIRKCGNGRKAVIEAAQRMRGDKSNRQATRTQQTPLARQSRVLRGSGQTDHLQLGEAFQESATKGSGPKV